MKISSTVVSKIVAKRRAKSAEGTYLPNSIAFMVCRLTWIRLANSACVMFLFARSTFILFFMAGSFVEFKDEVVKAYNEE